MVQPTTLDERLAAIAQPLHDERDRIAAELEQVEAQRSVLRDDLSRVEQILRRVNGTGKPGPKPGPKVSRARGEWVRPMPDKIEAVRQVMEAADFPRNEFSMQRVIERVDGMSKDTVNRAVLSLHEDGVLRLLKRTGRSGAKLYAYLGAAE